MKHSLLLFLILTFSCMSLRAQLKQGEFAFGGAGIDVGQSVIQSSDGGYALAGSTASYGAGGNDVYVVKLDQWGNLKWTKTVGGKYSDEGESIIETRDKGFVVVGQSNSFPLGSYDDVYVVKLDSAGNLKWTKTIGGGAGDNQGWSVTETFDKGLAIAGVTATYGAGGNDVYVIKLDSAGNLKWTKTIGGTFDDEGFSIVQTSDLGLAIAGSTASVGPAGYSHLYVIKLDSAGTLKWAETVGGISNENGSAIVETYDKGLAITGSSVSYGAGNQDVYVVKLDSAGALKWTRTIGGKGNENGSSIVETNDKGLAIAGWTNSYGAGSEDVYVIKLDSAGNLKWTRTIGGSSYEYGNSIIQTNDNGLAIAGYTNSYGAGSIDMFFIKLDSAGNFCSSSLKDSGSAGSGGFVRFGGTVGNGGKLNGGGVTGTGGTQTDICDIAASVNEITQSGSEHDYTFLTLYPNPSNGKFTIKLSGAGNTTVEIYNMLGEMVHTQHSVLTSRISVDISTQPNGIYLYRVLTPEGEEVATGKLVKD